MKYYLYLLPIPFILWCLISIHYTLKQIKEIDRILKELEDKELEYELEKTNRRHR